MHINTFFSNVFRSLDDSLVEDDNQGETLPTTSKAPQKRWSGNGVAVAGDWQFLTKNWSHPRRARNSRSVRSQKAPSSTFAEYLGIWKLNAYGFMNNFVSSRRATLLNVVTMTDQATVANNWQILRMLLVHQQFYLPQSLAKHF